MSVTPIVAPELFDAIAEYAGQVERDKETSSAPTDFCDNFYAQFFQNRMKRQITGFGNAAKEAAVKLRLTVETKESHEIVVLITRFEKYCDLRYDVFSEEYGGGSGSAVLKFLYFLEALLYRIIYCVVLVRLTGLSDFDV